MASCAFCTSSRQGIDAAVERRAHQLDDAGDAHLKCRMRFNEAINRLRHQKIAMHWATIGDSRGVAKHRTHDSHSGRQQPNVNSPSE